MKKSNSYGANTRPDVQRFVPTICRNILELGCAQGGLGADLKRRQRARVFGIEVSPEFAAVASGRLDEVATADVEEFVCGDAPGAAPFDCLVAADVLEHLIDPWETLRRSVEWLAPGAVVVVSVPNVFYWATLPRAAFSGHWPREEEGIFDSTHLRWFGPADVPELLTDAGLVEIEVYPSYWERGLRLWAARLLGHTRVGVFAPAQLIAVGRVPTIADLDQSTPTSGYQPEDELDRTEDSEHPR